MSAHGGPLRDALPAIGLLKGPPYGRLAAFVLPRQLCHRLAGRVPLGNAPALAGIERSRLAEPGAPAPGPLDPLLAALADQVALELGNTAHDRHHQPTDVRGRVAPTFPRGRQSHSPALEAHAGCCAGHGSIAPGGPASAPRRRHPVPATSSTGRTPAGHWWTSPMPSR